MRNFGLAKSGADLEARIARLMDAVRLPRDAVNRWPHEFSGGQRQRIGIARALAAEPDLIVCDEAVSALDVSVKAQIVNLLQDLQQELGLALLFISHDLAIVEHMTHRVAVMYLGKIVELGAKRQIFAAPKHPYTQALLSAVPVPEPGAARKRIILQGDVPSPINPPSGCRFHTRCPYVFDRCRTEEPPLRPTATGHFAACHLHDLPAAQNPLAPSPSSPHFPDGGDRAVGRVRGSRKHRRQLPPLTQARGMAPPRSLTRAGRGVQSDPARPSAPRSVGTVLGLAMAGEVEGRLLVALGEIEIAAGHHQLVAERERLRHDLPGRRDDA